MVQGIVADYPANLQSTVECDLRTALYHEYHKVNTNLEQVFRQYHCCHFLDQFRDRWPLPPPPAPTITTDYPLSFAALVRSDCEMVARRYRHWLCSQLQMALSGHECSTFQGLRTDIDSILLRD